MRRRGLAVFLAALLAAATAGCGLQHRARGTATSVLVTKDFGSTSASSATERSVPSGETVLQLLRSEFPVAVDSASRVRSVAALNTGGELGWTFFVNGIRPDTAAVRTEVHPGDSVWWDRHDISAGGDVRAVVGAFPEPFVHGVDGKRLPTTIGCATDARAACDLVTEALQRAGVPVSRQLLGAGSGADSLTVLVGTWRDVRGTIAGELIAHGPRLSGIYARFVDTGEQLQLLDPSGGVVRTLTAGAGLVAAIRDQVSQPTWMITGTDAAGVLAAARRVTPAQLHHHFALAADGAAADGERSIPVPLQPTR